MRVALITGAHGFLGRYCAREFSRAGWRVIGIGLGTWGKESPADFGISEWIGVGVTTDSLFSIGRHIDVVVHCAGSGSVGFSLSAPFDDFKMTVDTTAAVLEYLRTAAPAARLVYPSSAAVYGCLHSGPIREDSQMAPVSPYGVHKRIAEELCTSYGRSFQVASSVIRFFSLYGPGLRKQLIWDACTRLAKGEPVEFFGTGGEIRDWLHVCDAAVLVRMVAEAPASGLLINGGSGRTVTVRDALQQTATFLASGTQLSFNGIEREGDPRHLEADITSALELGWRPQISFEDGIAEYVDWFREESH